MRQIHNRIVIDSFIGNDGMDSNWSIVIQNGRNEDKLLVGLYWGDKQHPTHECSISKTDLIKYLNKI